MNGVLSPDQMADLAWRLLNQGVHEAVITLPNGGTIKVEDDQYVRLLQWIATLEIKKPKAVTKPEDFILRSTRQRGD